MPNPLGRVPTWVFLLLSIGAYTAACLSTALESTMGGPPMRGLECFFYGIYWCWLGMPLILWAPNLVVMILWFRVLAGRTTETRGAVVVPISAALSTLACCTLYPYQPRIGAWLWIGSAVLAGYAAWRVPPEPSGRGVRSVAGRRD